MGELKLQRPGDNDYYVQPWSDQLLQGDIFADVTLGFPFPPDAVVVIEGERRFVTGPFDAGPAMLISPSCAIAAQGPGVSSGAYAHPARVLVPIRPLADLLEQGVVSENNGKMLRADRLVNYLYLPASDGWPESAALLYMPITMHHDVIVDNRRAQLSGAAFWHLRAKLMVFFGGFLVHPNEFGPVPEATKRQS